MRQLAALVGTVTSGRSAAPRRALARGLVLAALATVLVAGLVWMRDGGAAPSPVADSVLSPAPPVDIAVRRMAAPQDRPGVIEVQPPARPAPARPLPAVPRAATLVAAFERAPDLYALSRDLAPAVMAGDAEALWVNSRIHDYCGGYAASPAGYARDTDVLAQLGGHGAAALRNARDRVAQRCGRFAPVDALTVAGIVRQREQAALAGHLAAEASLLAMDVPLDDSPEYLRDLVERVQHSGDAQAFSALSPGMGVAASGQRAFSGLVAGTQFAELAWQLAACRQGLACGPGSALMTQYCASGGICSRDGTQDFAHFVYDAAIPRQGAEQVEDMVDTLLQGVSRRLEQ
ncbi:hypothetical protein [Luteimonas yindakuii]|uniref:hypothetical protein n=1 Tax=Luteimonas yindakuii TaxID=2565782 RepID=UPI001FB7A7BA|nr:hypothetical protein [Luteimonas yindakuii]